MEYQNQTIVTREEILKVLEKYVGKKLGEITAEEMKRDLLEFLEEKGIYFAKEFREEIVEEIWLKMVDKFDEIYKPCPP